MTACVLANCTLADRLPAQRFKADTCNEPVRDRGGLSRRLCWAMFVIATLLVLCRFLSRTPVLGGQGYSWDDWTVLFCYVLLVPTDVTAEIEVQNGLGMDMFMLSVDQIVTVLQVSAAKLKSLSDVDLADVLSRRALLQRHRHGDQNVSGFALSSDLDC